MNEDRDVIYLTPVNGLLTLEKLISARKTQ